MAQDKATSLEDKIAEMKQNFKTKEQEAKESHDKTVQVSYRVVMYMIKKPGIILYQLIIVSM